jgi:two-component system, NarL family, nitrate/nitrite response regulator NarL
MTSIDRRITVTIAETQPVLVEGVRSILSATARYTLIDAVASLDAVTRVMLTANPRIAIVDKAFGMPALTEWLTRVQDHNGFSAVVWGNSLNDAEALRLLKSGARGVIRKTAPATSLLACLDSVAGGSTWMEDALFQQSMRYEPSGRSDLTVREQQVLSLVEQGLRNKEIAAELGIRPGTVKIHLKHIFEKTGVRGRFGLALSGLRERSEPERLIA